MTCVVASPKIAGSVQDQAGGALHLPLPPRACTQPGGQAHLPLAPPQLLSPPKKPSRKSLDFPLSPHTHPTPRTTRAQPTLSQGLIFGVALVRVVVFTFFWICLGRYVWLLPNLFNEEIPISEVLKPLHSVTSPEPGAFCEATSRAGATEPTPVLRIPRVRLACALRCRGGYCTGRLQGSALLLLPPGRKRQLGQTRRREATAKRGRGACRARGAEREPPAEACFSALPQPVAGTTIRLANRLVAALVVVTTIVTLYRRETRDGGGLCTLRRTAVACCQATGERRLLRREFRC